MDDAKSCVGFHEEATSLDTGLLSYPQRKVTLLLVSVSCNREELLCMPGWIGL